MAWRGRSGEEATGLQVGRDGASREVSGHLGPDQPRTAPGQRGRPGPRPQGGNKLCVSEDQEAVLWPECH